MSGGALGGIGNVVSPSLTSAAELSPAFAEAGILSLDGPFTAAPAAKLYVDVAGAAVGTGYDRLAVSGSAGLGGTLYVRTAPGYAPAPGTSFKVLTCSARSGSFANLVVLPAAPSSPCMR